MNTLLIAFQLVATAPAHAHGQIDQVCEGAFCESLSVKGEFVRFIDSTPPPRTIVLGRLIPQAQHFVPQVEAPLWDMRSETRWRVIVSAFLQHSGDNEGAVGLRARFFSGGPTLSGSFDMYGLLEGANLGTLFGGDDDIFALTSNEEHAYDVETEIWLLPPNGIPRRLLAFPGVYDRFNRAIGGRPAGVLVSRETYDGEHAETKGRIKQFWAWDSEKKTLNLSKN
jgi:hypothetical protein